MPPRPIAPLAHYSESLSSQIDDISPFQQLTSPMQIYTITHKPPHPPLPNRSISSTAPLLLYGTAPSPSTELLHFLYRAVPFIYETALILPLFFHISVKEVLHTYPPSPNDPRMPHPPSAHLCLPTHARTAPHLRPFAYQLTHAQPHTYAPSPTNLRAASYQTTLTHKSRTHCPPLSTFIHQLTHEPPRISAPLPINPRTNRTTSAHLRPPTHARTAARLPTLAQQLTHEAPRVYVRLRSFLPRGRSC